MVNKTHLLICETVFWMLIYYCSANIESYTTLYSFRYVNSCNWLKNFNYKLSELNYGPTPGLNHRTSNFPSYQWLAVVSVSSTTTPKVPLIRSVYLPFPHAIQKINKCSGNATNQLSHEFLFTLDVNKANSYYES